MRTKLIILLVFNFVIAPILYWTFIIYGSKLDYFYWGTLKMTDWPFLQFFSTLLRWLECWD